MFFYCKRLLADKVLMLSNGSTENLIILEVFLKILVADDHALIREAMHHLLKQIDSSAILLEAWDCQSIRANIEQNVDLDLLLLDLKLPGIGGLELLNEFRRNYPTLPIIVMSGIEDTVTIREVLNRGARGFIPKSSPNDVMLSAIKLVISGGKYIPQEVLANAESGQISTPQTLDEIHLTERQREVLMLLAQGKSNKIICHELGLAEPTVKIHVTAILRALKVTSRAQVIVAMNRLGLADQIQS